MPRQPLKAKEFRLRGRPARAARSGPRTARRSRLTRLVARALLLAALVRCSLKSLAHARRGTQSKSRIAHGFARRALYEAREATSGTPRVELEVDLAIHLTPKPGDEERSGAARKGGARLFHQCVVTASRRTLTVRSLVSSAREPVNRDAELHPVMLGLLWSLRPQDRLTARWMRFASGHALVYERQEIPRMRTRPLEGVL